MRIKSNVKCNLGNIAGGLRVVFPAEAVIELDDNMYAAHIPFIKVHKEKGNFTVLKAPVLSAKEQAKADEADEAKLKAQLAAIEKRKAAAKTEGK